MTVTLKDGSRVVIRPVTPEDKPLFAEAFERFGEESRYRRFMSFKRRLSPEDLAFFTEVDHHDHEALGAIDPETGEGLGVARYVREPDDPTAAEAAVAVVDAWQSRGLGGTLLERLARRATEEGISHFRASLFTSNRGMLHLFEDLGEMRHVSREDDVYEIDVALPVGEGSQLGHALRAAAAGHVEG
jgi:GNAT superfamily N-acetyltransferase